LPEKGTISASVEYMTAVLTVDRVDDAGHRLACQRAAGHPQRAIDGLFASSSA